LLLLGLATTPALAADAAKGKAAFMKNGCWQCHGEVGKAGAAGKTLAPKPMPLEAFNVFVRNSNGQMPPYPKEILSDADLATSMPIYSRFPRARTTRAFRCSVSRSGL
jgi:ubiquinol-cytochrome c reductase cytochrome c subunit